jgi:hypothetical protein
MVKISRHLSIAKRFSRSVRTIDKSPVGPRSTEDKLMSFEDLALRDTVSDEIPTPYVLKRTR